jgi:hypothetical protein
MCSPAVDVKQKASPPRHEVPMVVRPPAIGRDINSPIAAAVELVVADERCVVCDGST